MLQLQMLHEDEEENHNCQESASMVHHSLNNMNEGTSQQCTCKIAFLFSYSRNCDQILVHKRGKL
jgi:hypothetical protein